MIRLTAYSLAWAMLTAAIVLNLLAVGFQRVGFLIWPELEEKT